MYRAETNTYSALLSAEEHELLRLSSELARDYLGGRAEEADRSGELLPENLEVLSRAGVMAAQGPRELGGLGASCLATVMSLERLAAACAGTAAVALFHHSVVRRLCQAGSAEQQQRLLPWLMRQALSASAWAEPGSGADKKKLATVARRQGSGFCLSGRKSFCTGARMAELCTVLVETPELGAEDGEPIFGRSTQSFFLVHRDRPGVSIGPPFEGLGLRGSGTAELILDEVPVSADDLLGGLGQGTRVMALQRSSGLHPGVLGLGIGSAALEATCHFVKGRGTAQFQAVRFALADMAVELEGARLLVYEAARQADLASPVADRLGLLAKIRAAEAAQAITAAAVQLWGQTGFHRGHPIERLFRDARALSIMGPTSELCRDLVASRDLEAIAPPIDCP